MMDGNNRKLEGSGEHIWLRYATQITAGGRSHTVEMNVPLPLGASAETREQLLREAEAGLSQLISHIEGRIPQILQRAHTPSSASAVPAPKAPVPAPAHRPASVSAPQTAAHPSTQPVSAGLQVRESAPPPARAETEEDGDGEFAERPGSGVTMPSLPGGGNNNLSIPEFVQAIKELGLNPQQAMKMLGVKSLSTINRRKALDRLQYLVAGEEPVEQKIQESRDSSVATPSNIKPLSNSAASARVSSRPPVIEDEEDEEEEHNYGRAPIPIFDEEVEPEEGDAFGDEEEEDNSQGLTPAERNRAHDIVHKMRESRGANTVSSARLQALHNVIGDQISEEQLQTLVEGLWGVTNLRKLKVDQVEALIYWAKEDEFVNEVEIVLLLLEEES